MTVNIERTPRQAMLIERWQNALRVLQSMSTHERRKHFDMRHWGKKTECGTVACLAGHCSMDPWFRDQGFRSEFVNKRLDFTGVNPWVFFGNAGDDEVFRAIDDTYTKVVRRVKKWIKYLERGGNPDRLSDPNWLEAK